ncbi:MAG TPA: hypothetical protein VF933_14400 [Streptosporangiaceae bacterium]
MAIAALVVWVLTAGAGLVLLLAGSAAKRGAAPQAAPAPLTPVTVPAPGPAQPGPRPGPARPGPARPGPGPGPGDQPGPVPGAGPATRPAGPPPIPRVTVHATPGEHPFLEFSHPVLGLIGMGVWFIFVGTHHAPLAWVSFGILVAAIAAGLSWLARNTLAARRGDPPPRAGFPPRLVLLHGFAASATLVLAVLTALAASHA